MCVGRLTVLDDQRYYLIDDDDGAYRWRRTLMRCNYWSIVAADGAEADGCI